MPPRKRDRGPCDAIQFKLFVVPSQESAASFGGVNNRSPDTKKLAREYINLSRGGFLESALDQ